MVTEDSTEGASLSHRGCTTGQQERSFDVELQRTKSAGLADDQLQGTGSREILRQYP